MELSLKQTLDILAHFVYIFSVIYIMMEVIPNSKLLSKVYPEFIISIFRLLIGINSFFCFKDMLHISDTSLTELVFMWSLAALAAYVSWYSPILEVVLDRNFIERKAPPAKFIQKFKAIFHKKNHSV